MTQPPMCPILERIKKHPSSDMNLRELEACSSCGSSKRIKDEKGCVGCKTFAKLTREIRPHVKNERSNRDLVGCTYDEFIEYLDQTMSPETRDLLEMGEEANIDHIIPVHAPGIDLTNDIHVRALCYYTNFQWLDKPTNQQKNNKVPIEFDLENWLMEQHAHMELCEWDGAKPVETIPMKAKMLADARHFAIMIRTWIELRVCWGFETWREFYIDPRERGFSDERIKLAADKRIKRFWERCCGIHPNLEKIKNQPLRMWVVRQKNRANHRKILSFLCKHTQGYDHVGHAKRLVDGDGGRGVRST